MMKVPIVLAAAILSAGVLAEIPASAMVPAAAPPPIVGGPSTSSIQTIAMRGHRFIIRNRFAGGRRFMAGHRFANRRFAFRHRFVNRRFAFRHPFRNRAFFAFEVAPAFVGPAYGYGYPNVDYHIQYCTSRYRSYDPASDTFMGYDGIRHRCGESYSSSYAGSYSTGSYGGSY